MIFSGNKTALGATTIPMAEGYDCSYGVGLALVEAARNDLSMFQALVQADYKEMAICKESTGVVQEGEISALHEAVGGGIFKKIAELFKKLVAKIKAIFHNFMAKINGLTMKDKELVKKYQTELARKRNLDKLEVKFRKPKNASSVGALDFNVVENFDKAKGWKEDSWERVRYYLDPDADSVNEFIKAKIDDELEDELYELDPDEPDEYEPPPPPPSTEATSATIATAARATEATTPITTNVAVRALSFLSNLAFSRFLAITGSFGSSLCASLSSGIASLYFSVDV